jgi:hypothetical protein
MPFNIGLALDRLGDVAVAREDRLAAGQYYQEALAIFEAIGVPLADSVRKSLRALTAGEADEAEGDGEK